MPLKTTLAHAPTHSRTHARFYAIYGSDPSYLSDLLTCLHPVPYVRPPPPLLPRHPLPPHTHIHARFYAIYLWSANMSTLRPVRSPPLLILAYSRSNNINARRMAFAFFSTLDLTFGTHFYLDFRFCSTLSFFKTTKLKTTPTPPTTASTADSTDTLEFDTCTAQTSRFYQHRQWGCPEKLILSTLQPFSYNSIVLVTDSSFGKIPMGLALLLCKSEGKIFRKFCCWLIQILVRKPNKFRQRGWSQARSPNYHGRLGWEREERDLCITENPTWLLKRKRRCKAHPLKKRSTC